MGIKIDFRKANQPQSDSTTVVPDARIALTLKFILVFASKMSTF
jgi:hypothetical protein